MASASKNKGKSFEREVAKLLSKAFNENFERVPNSGAFVGGKNKSKRMKVDEDQERIFLGDIIPPKDWEIVIECKNYKKLDGGFEKVLHDRNAKIEKWLTELTYDAEHRFHILFMKFNYIGTFFVLPLKMNVDISYFGKVPRMFFLFNDKPYVIFSSSYLENPLVKEYILKYSRKDHYAK